MAAERASSKLVVDYLKIRKGKKVSHHELVKELGIRSKDVSAIGNMITSAWADDFIEVTTHKRFTQESITYFRYLTEIDKYDNVISIRRKIKKNSFSAAIESVRFCKLSRFYVA
mgnify:CR=1 FL=1